MFRAAILAAVSTIGQASDEKASLPEQIAEGRRVCAERDWHIVAEITIPGHSRDYLWLHHIIADCPPYAELVRLIETEQVSLVICRHYDRLWRTDALRSQFMALCREHHVQVYSILQPQEPLSPDLIVRRPGLRGVMETLSGIISEEEQNLRVARTQGGMRGRIARGLHGSYPNPPYGYRPDAASGLMVVVPEEAEWVRWIFRRRCEGIGPASVARELNRLGVAIPGAARPVRAIVVGAWRQSTIRRILHNSLYIGVVHWGQVSNAQGQHEPIIDAATWERVQELTRAGVYLKGGEASGTNLLQGVARCALCGCAMVYRIQEGHPYLRCSRYLSTGKTRCHSNGHSGDRVHRYVLDAVTEALSDPAAWEMARAARRDSAGAQQELDQIAAALAEYQAQCDQWAHAYATRVIGLNEYAGHRQRIERERAALMARQSELQAQATDGGTARQAIAEYADLGEQLHDAPVSVQQQITRRLIRTVKLEKGKVPEIDWW